MKEWDTSRASAMTWKAELLAEGLDSCPVQAGLLQAVATREMQGADEFTVAIQTCSTGKKWSSKIPSVGGMRKNYWWLWAEGWLKGWFTLQGPPHCMAHCWCPVLDLVLLSAVGQGCALEVHPMTCGGGVVLWSPVHSNSTHCGGWSQHWGPIWWLYGLVVMMHPCGMARVTPPWHLFTPAILPIDDLLCREVGVEASEEAEPRGISGL